MSTLSVQNVTNLQTINVAQALTVTGNITATGSITSNNLGVRNVQTFSANGTWCKPTDKVYNFVKVQLWGGAGGAGQAIVTTY